MKLFPTVFTRSKPSAPAGPPKPETQELMTSVAVSQLIEMLTVMPEVDETLATLGIPRSHLRKLEADDEIFQLLRTRREAVIATPWRLEGGDKATVDLLIEELTPIIHSIISGAWKAIPYGYSVMEAVYKIRDDRKIGLADVAIKPMEWFQPKPSGILKYFSPDGAVIAEDVDTVYKFMLTRSEATYQNPMGEALLSRLYWPWFFRFNGWRFWGQFIERFGQPLLVGKSSNPKTMAAALVQAHQDAVIAVGGQDSVDAIAPSTSGEAFEKLESAVLRRYQRVVLGQTLTSDTGKNGGGSFALGKVHAEVKESLRRSDIRLVASTIQALVKALCLLNGKADVPTFVMADDSGLEEARSKRDVELSKLGVKFSKGYFTDRYDLKDEDFELGSVVEDPNGDALGPNGTPVPPEGEGSAPTGAQTALDEAQAARKKRIHDTLVFARARKADPKRFTGAQGMIEDTADAAMSMAGQPIDLDVVRAAVFAATSPEDLEDRLATVLRGTTATNFRQVLEVSLAFADVLGYVRSEGKV